MKVLLLTADNDFEKSLKKHLEEEFLKINVKRTIDIPEVASCDAIIINMTTQLEIDDDEKFSSSKRRFSSSKIRMRTRYGHKFVMNDKMRSRDKSKLSNKLKPKSGFLIALTFQERDPKTPIFLYENGWQDIYKNPLKSITFLEPLSGFDELTTYLKVIEQKKLFKFQLKQILRKLEQLRFTDFHIRGIISYQNKGI